MLDHDERTEDLAYVSVIISRPNIDPELQRLGPLLINGYYLELVSSEGTYYIRINSPCMKFVPREILGFGVKFSFSS